MKKNAITLGLVLALTGCGKNEEAAQPANKEPIAVAAPQGEQTPASQPTSTPAQPIKDDSANLVGMWAFNTHAVFPEITFYTNKQFQYIRKGYAEPVNGVYQLEVYTGSFEADVSTIKLTFEKSSCKGEKTTQEIAYYIAHHNTGKDLVIGKGDVYWNIEFPKYKTVVYGCYSEEGKFEKSDLNLLE